MKVKLLKKVRKRYNWYFNNDKFPVLIDHHTKSCRVYDIEYLSWFYKYSLDDIKVKVKVQTHEWALRTLKTDILGEYGWRINRYFYRRGNKVYKLKLRK